MRRIGWLAAIPAFALACATSSSSEKMSDTTKAQSSAQSAFQKAADAQKKAVDEQQKLEQAQRDVVAAQKALADAQARLEGQRGKAEQAQRDAQQLAADANQQAQQDQQQALQLQKQQVQQHKQMTSENQKSWMQTKNVEGRAVSAANNELMVRSSDQGDLRLKVNDSTSVNVDGKMGSLDQIKPGSDVRASYQLVDGQPTALTIEVTNQGSSSVPQK